MGFIISSSTRIGAGALAPSSLEYLVVAGGGGGGGAGNGGSGIVVVRHPDTYAQATVTGSPTITTSGGYIVYKFTGSGTISWN